MTIRIELPEATQKALNALAARRGQDPAAFVLSLVDEAILFDGFETTDPDNERDQADARAGIGRGLDAFARGEHKPHAQVVAEAKARHGLPDAWPDA